MKSPRYLAMACLLSALSMTATAGSVRMPAATERGVALRPVGPRILHRSVRFADWPLSDWRVVREGRYPDLGKWVRADQGIVNYIAPDADPNNVVSAKGGVGIATAIIEGVETTDCTVIARVAFEGKGAPAILLRAQVEGDVVGEVLSLVLYHNGVNLWRFDGKKWSKDGFAKFAVEERVFHRMKVVLSGSRARVWVDGEAVIETDSVGLVKPGAIGIWAGEGPCHFDTFRLRHVASE